MVAEQLGLPAPKHYEEEYCSRLQGTDADEWFKLAGVVRNHCLLHLDRRSPTGPRSEYVDRNDPDVRIRSDLRARPLLYMTFMELVGVMDAAFGEHERKLELMYPWHEWEKWYTPEPDAVDPDHDAYNAREEVIRRSFCFFWG